VVNKPIINRLPIAANANLNFMIPLLCEVKNITDIVEKRYRKSRLFLKNPLTLTTPASPGLLISGNLNFNPEYKNISSNVVKTL
jgi:hypothetical protein